MDAVEVVARARLLLAETEKNRLATKNRGRLPR
jgi:hypothetical protein